MQIQRYLSKELFVAMTLAPWLASCAHRDAYVWVDELPQQELSRGPYQIRAGDEIAISVWNQEHLSARARVRLDGMATLPLLGDIRLAGATTPAAARHVRELLKGLVLDPKVTITVLEARPPTIAVVGEVREPGSVSLEPGDGILNVLAKAGGLTEFAHDDEIYVLRRAPSPLRVRFDYGRLTAGASRGIEFSLTDGDVVVVR